jgi:hypothetical protein
MATLRSAGDVQCGVLQQDGFCVIQDHPARLQFCSLEPVNLYM